MIIIKNLARVPYTGGNKVFTLHITPKTTETMNDVCGEICLHRVIEHLLPRFDNMVVHQQSI